MTSQLHSTRVPLSRSPTIPAVHFCKFELKGLVRALPAYEFSPSFNFGSFKRCVKKHLQPDELTIQQVEARCRITLKKIVIKIYLFVYRWKDINYKELKEIIGYAGFRKMASQYFLFGFKEIMRSAIIPLQVHQIQRYISDITEADVESGPAGVRAQAMAKDGTLIDDFVFDSQPGSGAIGSRVLHCRNAPSPGATSSLAIARMIADKLKDEFKL